MADLPAPNHSLLYGYWFDVSAPRDFDQYLNDYRLDVIGVVNAVVILAQSANGDLGLLDSWFQNLSGKSILFYPDVGSAAAPTINDNTTACVNIAAPYWDSINYIMFDELPFDAAGTDAFLDSFNVFLDGLGLPHKPFYVNSGIVLAAGGSWASSRVDVAGFDAYIDPARQNDGDVVTQLNNLIDANLALLAGKPCIITTMGYDRNGLWTNMESLSALQDPPYTKSYNNTTVLGIIIFSFGRHGGTHFLPPAIRTKHLRQWAAIANRAQPDTISATGSFTPVPFNQHVDCGFFCKALSCFVPATLAGIYKLIPDKRHDTLYSTITDPENFTTIDKAIPNPFAETTLLPSSDS